MTLLTKPDSRVICRIQLTGNGRWVRLSLSLGDIASAMRFVTYSESLLYDMAGIDEMAREYGLANWQGGIISGARYALRVLKAPIQQICVHELRGQLGRGDVGAVSSAVALAVARLLGRPAEFPLNLNGWTIEEEISRPESVEGTPESGNAGSCPPEPIQGQRAEHSLASGNTGTKEATQDRPANPTADRPPD